MASRDSRLTSIQNVCLWNCMTLSGALAALVPRQMLHVPLISTSSRLALWYAKPQLLSRHTPECMSVGLYSSRSVTLQQTGFIQYWVSLRPLFVIHWQLPIVRESRFGLTKRVDHARFVIPKRFILLRRADPTKSHCRITLTIYRSPLLSDRRKFPRGISPERIMSKPEACPETLKPLQLHCGNDCSYPQTSCSCGAEWGTFGKRSINVSVLE